MKAKILKAVVSDGKKIEAGTIVDVSAWRNAKTLISGRYIEILDQSAEKPKAKEETPVVEKETTPVVTATAKPKATAKISDK